jgi:hypothetical protein
MHFQLRYDGSGSFNATDRFFNRRQSMTDEELQNYLVNHENITEIDLYDTFVACNELVWPVSELLTE